MKILVTAATGNIGQHAVRQLVEAGHEVRATTSNENKVNQLEALGAEAVIADLKRPQRNLFEGVDRALLTSPIGSDMEQVGKRLNQLAAEVGIDHAVRISILSTYIDEDIVLGRWHAAVDADLAESGLSHSILRPTGFMQNLFGMADSIREGKLFAPTGEGRVAFIDAADIAASAVAILTDKANPDAPVDLTGPDALSFGEVAAILTEVLGRPISFTNVPLAAAREQLLSSGMDDVFADAVIEDMGMVKDGGGAAITNGVEQLTGRKPRDLKTFIEEHKTQFQIQS